MMGKLEASPSLPTTANPCSLLWPRSRKLKRLLLEKVITTNILVNRD
jgi:hypothetical protein